MTTKQQAEAFMEDVEHFALHWKDVDCVSTDTEKTFRQGRPCIILRVFVFYDEG